MAIQTTSNDFEHLTVHSFLLSFIVWHHVLASLISVVSAPFSCSYAEKLDVTEAVDICNSLYLESLSLESTQLMGSIALYMSTTVFRAQKIVVARLLDTLTSISSVGRSKRGQVATTRVSLLIKDLSDLGNAEKKEESCLPRTLEI
jgi:hypothetical protein